MTADWPQYLPLVGLVFARCAGVLCLAPPTGARYFPVPLRVAVAAVLAVPLALSLGPGPTVALPPAAVLAFVVQEFALGLLMGLPLWLLLWGMFAAGHLAEAGLVPDDEEGPLAAFFYLLAVLLFIQLNGHHWLIAFLHDSYAAVPVAGSAHLFSNLDWVYWPARLLAQALTVAAPLVLAVVLAALVAASAQRCLRELQAAPLGPALRYVVALVTLVAVAPLLGGVVLGQVQQAAGDLAGWLTAIGR